MGIRLVIEGNSVYEIDEDCRMNRQGRQQNKGKKISAQGQKKKRKNE